jgi:polyhydroxyalkanoate synthesis regulator phasin
MKILLALLSISFMAFAGKTVKDFNKVLIDDVKTNVKKDDESFKTNQGRSPASIPTATETEVMQDQKKSIDKIEKNVKQLGPKEW